MLFAHKRIIIIGGSSGMGLATAIAATAAGARVVIASRSREKLEAARLLAGHPGQGQLCIRLGYLLPGCGEQ